ncbi:XRE family transcriptional regulator [Dawidia soli]|uniref:XRE family transcriptional regulator n=1 Tax=Dawidia soli TaxID=2782352 RepID=A0AAP2GJQ0_9BACT|nr:XRE family transcriptional regulator [Dawidia soli]MBT1688208.1 XRE family transcriptional regulator [Dawidia soli]
MTEEKVLRQFAESVARVFVGLRKEKGYTSYESFAFDHEFPRAQYWRVETGRHNLTLRTLTKLLIIHNLTLEEFLQRVIVESRTFNRKDA